MHAETTLDGHFWGWVCFHSFGSVTLLLVYAEIFSGEYPLFTGYRPIKQFLLWLRKRWERAWRVQDQENDDDNDAAERGVRGHSPARENDTRSPVVRYCRRKRYSSLGSSTERVKIFDRKRRDICTEGDKSENIQGAEVEGLESRDHDVISAIEIEPEVLATCQTRAIPATSDKTTSTEDLPLSRPDDDRHSSEDETNGASGDDQKKTSGINSEFPHGQPGRRSAQGSLSSVSGNGGSPHVFPRLPCSPGSAQSLPRAPLLKDRCGSMQIVKAPSSSDDNFSFRSLPSLSSEESNFEVPEPKTNFSPEVNELLRKKGWITDRNSTESLQQVPEGAFYIPPEEMDNDLNRMDVDGLLSEGYESMGNIFQEDHVVDEE